jgi:hypothetical protein
MSSGLRSSQQQRAQAQRISTPGRTARIPRHAAGARARCLHKPSPHEQPTQRAPLTPSLLEPHARAPLERASALAASVERVAPVLETAGPVAGVSTGAESRLRIAVDVDEGECEQLPWFQGWEALSKQVLVTLVHAGRL